MKLTTIKNFYALILVATTINLSIANADAKARSSSVKADANTEVTTETAEFPKSQNIAVVDLENVLKNCDAMKDAQQKISKKQAGFQKEIDQKQKDLEKESKQINSKKGVLSEDAFAKEQEKFSKKVDELKEVVNSRQESLKAASLDAIDKINGKMKEAIEEVRAEKNLDIILSSAGTVFYKDELNISAEITKKLNKKISKINVK